MIIISFSVLKTFNSIFIIIYLFGGFPGGSVVKNLLVKQETWFNPGSRQSPGEGNCNPLQYSCLGNPMDGEA